MRQPPRVGDDFNNWARTAVSTPTSWALPETERAVVEQIRRGTRVRVVGAGHSFSAIAAPEHTAVSLDRLRGQLVQGDGVVTVPGGMRLKDLSAWLAGRGLALPIVGSIQEQSVAGAIATGTHGSSLVHGNLATLVEHARLVDGRGSVQELSGERLEAARVHLGALGVITEVTVRVVPAYRLRQVIENVPVEEVRLEEVARSAEFVKVWWLPHTREAHVIRYDRTDEPATSGPVRRRALDEQVMHKALFPALVALQHRAPRLVPALNRGLVRTYLGPAVQVGASALMLNTPLPVRHRETEAAVPLAVADRAFGATVALIRERRLAVNFPVEVRFVKGDRTWMSPAYGGDTCQLGAYCTDGPDCDAFFDGFWDAMRPLNARPHWGKELNHSADELRGLYPRFDDFVALRDELDPDRVFTNAFLDGALG